MAFHRSADQTAPATRRRLRGWTVAAATVVAGVLVSGVSYAYWTATGSGSASVTSVTAQPLGVVSSSPVVADLYPGKPMEALTFTIANPNSYGVKILTASLGTYTSSSESTCPAATNLSVAVGPYTLNVTVPANSSLNVSIPAFVQMVTGAQDPCQGKTFSFPLTLTGNQV